MSCIFKKVLLSQSGRKLQHLLAFEVHCVSRGQAGDSVSVDSCRTTQFGNFLGEGLALTARLRTEDKHFLSHTQ